MGGIIRHSYKLLIRTVSVILSVIALSISCTVWASSDTISLNKPGFSQELSLHLLDADYSAHIEYWALASRNNSCNVKYFPNTISVVTFSSGFSVLYDDDQAKKILEKAIELIKAKCPESKSWTAIAAERHVATDLNKIAAGGSPFIYFVFDRINAGKFVDTDGNLGVLAQLTHGKIGSGQDVDWYQNNASAKNRLAIREQNERDQRTKAQRSLNQKAQSFADKYGATGGWVNWDRLKSNPFSYKDQVLLFNTEFLRMITPTSGIFGSIVVSNIPKNAFTQQVTVMLTGKVLGTTHVKNQFGGEISVPHVKYLGHMVCPNSDCGGLFHATVRGK